MELKNVRSAFKHSYRKQRLRSVVQLRRDFGEFPPFPLKCLELTSEIAVVRAAGAGLLLNGFVIGKHLVRLATKREGVEIQTSVDFGEGQEGIDDYNSLIRSAPLFLRKSLARTLRWAAIFALAKKMKKPGRDHERGLGVFLPTGHKTGRITLTSNILAPSVSEAVISHEHIHFLQHLDGQQVIAPERKLAPILLEEKLSNSFLLYVLEKKEVEARLHEIVLSFYRDRRELPLTPQSFIEMLAASASFQEYVIDHLETAGHSLGKVGATFRERASMFSDQLAMAFTFMKAGCEYRFMAEVLTVMYGNLLRYYGAEEASLEFLSAIPRPNLYDEIYGEILQASA
jgi:hypothetical protein